MRVDVDNAGIHRSKVTQAFVAGHGRLALLKAKLITAWQRVPHIELLHQLKPVSIEAQEKYFRTRAICA